MWHYIHRIDKENTGDYKCGPLEYFFHMFPKQYLVHDIYTIDYTSIKKDDVVILGGGGLFDCINKWNININKLFDVCDNIVSWGCGSNTYNTVITDQIHFEKFKLLSIKDYNHPSKFTYVPCVSCMMPELSNSFRIKRKIGIVEHKNNPLSEFNFPKISNRSCIDDMLEFIGSSLVIITNSYHACYWATLLKRKVILFKERSTKFDYFEYKPVRYSGNLDKDIRKAKVFEEALDNCRHKNILFARQVKQLFFLIIMLS